MSRGISSDDVYVIPVTSKPASVAASESIAPLISPVAVTAAFLLLNPSQLILGTIVPNMPAKWRMAAVQHYFVGMHISENANDMSIPEEKTDYKKQNSTFCPALRFLF